MKKGLQLEFIKTISQLVTAGFGLVAALAWNEVIKDFISRFIAPGSTLISRLIYAIIVTLLAVIITYYIGRLAQEAKEKEES
jgi:ABC-type cobalt transport system substrate-binding protein